MEAIHSATGTTAAGAVSTTLTDGVLVVKVASRDVRPEKVVFNPPATVVVWDDGSKTVVRCDEEDMYDEREGFLLCCAKRLMGNGGSYNDELAEHCPSHGADLALQVLRGLA